MTPKPDSAIAPLTTEHPIIFSGPMVRAILEDRKTMTRRVITPQPKWNHTVYKDSLGAWGNWSSPDGAQTRLCPYGRSGDRLWVREKWASPDPDKKHYGRVAYNADGLCGYFIEREFVFHGRILEADGYRQSFPREGSDTYSLSKYSDIRLKGEYPQKAGWRPSIHMPRWASRITLEITDIRIERVQDINEWDAKAEGTEVQSVMRADEPCISYKEQFALLWDAINGKRLGCSWRDNPWVWCVRFRKLQ